jgi:spermidine synthase
MAGSTGRKTVSVSRGLIMLCETCYDQVMADKLTDAKNFVTDHDNLFDTICVGCTDINRPLIDDMAGSGE